MLKDEENRYLDQKFDGRSYFSFTMVRSKLFSGGKIRNFPLSRCTLCQKKCYITKGIQPILKNFPSAERRGKQVFAPKISWEQLFQFSNSNVKTFTKGKFEISQFQAAHCARKNAISPKVFNRSSKTFLLLKDVENRYLDKKFSGRSYFSFAMVR